MNGNPSYDGDTICIHEWPQPMCEIYDKRTRQYVSVRTPKDAEALLDSLARFIASIPDRL